MTEELQIAGTDTSTLRSPVQMIFLAELGIAEDGVKELVGVLPGTRHLVRYNH